MLSAPLLDRNKTTSSAHTRGGPVLGQPGTPDLAAKMDEVAEGAFPLFTEDGDAVYAAISRSPRTGWTIAPACRKPPPPRLSGHRSGFS